MASERHCSKSLPTTFAPEKNTLVMARDKPARVLVIEPTQASVMFLGTTETAWVPITSLGPYVETRFVETDQRSRKEGDVDLEHAYKWYRLLAEQPLEQEKLALRKRKIASAMGVSVRTVERQMLKFCRDPSPQGLLAFTPGPQAGSRKHSSGVQALIDRAICSGFLSDQKNSLAKVHRDLRVECQAAGERAPSYSTLYRRVAHVDRIEKARRRHGRVLAKALAEPAGPKTKRYAPLEFVQMDHALADIIVVDSLQREPIGRPWLTLAIDVATRTVPGFYYSLSAPDHANVGVTLERCCLPKDWLEAYGYEMDWLPYGLMKSVGWDNAKYFRAIGLVNACKRIGIEPVFRRVRTPTHGAFIERYIGTMMGALHMLPGTTFSHPQQRGDYDSEKLACMTLPELIHWTAVQINDVYHNTPHAGLREEFGVDTTPLEAWLNGMSVRGSYSAPRVPTDRFTFRCELLPSVERIVGREGIKRFAIKYWDSSLAPLIGKSVCVAHDPGDISTVFVKADDQWLRVPWRDRSLPPCTLNEYVHRRRHNSARDRTALDGETTLRAMRQQREIEDAAKIKTKATRRRQEQRPVDRPAIVGAIEIDFSKPSEVLEDPF